MQNARQRSLDSQEEEISTLLLMQLKKVVEKLNTYKTDCLEMAQLLCKSKLKLEK